MAPPTSNVFISYNHADRDWAEWIAGVIERVGYEPILDVWHFRPGENFVLRMDEAAKESGLIRGLPQGSVHSVGMGRGVCARSHQ
jgi:hypothetical protein